MFDAVTRLCRDALQLLDPPQTVLQLTLAGANLQPETTGLNDGDIVGLVVGAVGDNVGLDVGAVGEVVGDVVGLVVGEVVGLVVGEVVGDVVGEVVGLLVGDVVGFADTHG
mmetsp:Transcript_33990/g.70692  ORF Transcript_33990/g.70692 Transcript_33990/m.70692 type:complete len:111 (-) Transcript_33990:1198-1530(-)